MSPSPFTGRPLTEPKISQAYPLVALAPLRLGADQWRWLAHAILSETEPPPVGIMTLQTPAGYIHGLFRFRASADGRGVPTLFVDDLVAPDLFGGALAAAIVDLLDELAARHRCAAIDIGLPLPDTTDGRLRGRLCHRGYGVRRRSLVKAP